MTRTGYIYWISTDNGGSYVGSCWDMNDRKNRHYSNITKPLYYNYPLYQHLRKCNNWCMELIEHVECKNVYERLWTERYWYDIIEPNLNIIRPITTDIEHKIQKNIYNKQYREKHKDELNEKDKIRHIKKYTCECGSTISKGSKSYHNKSKKHQQYLATV